MKNKIELLAPGGNVNSIKAAIAAGADAIYCGLEKFNARNRADNISFQDLQGILILAHKNNCQVFLTLNILILDNEIPSLISLLNKLANTDIDGLIIQDLGMFYILSKYFKHLEIHASTQLTTHNKGQIKFLSELSAKRVNLSRELNINEIKSLALCGHKNNISTEVFVHGSYCISFSGICYMSSVLSGNSGNRGRCSQPCRDKYITTQEGKNYPLNLKDNSAFFNLQELHDAGVDSLKIEGRIKKSDYVYTVVKTYKNQLDKLLNNKDLSKDDQILYKVFNRDFSNSFLTGKIDKNMFIDNPRDHSILHLSEINNYTSEQELEKAHLALYAEKDEIKNKVENIIKQLSIAKHPLKIEITGESNNPLNVSIETTDSSFIVSSDKNLSNTGTEALNRESILKRLKAINETEYEISQLNFNLKSNLYLPFKELTLIKNKILFILNESKEIHKPVLIPKLIKQENENLTPTLSVIISSENDLSLCEKTNSEIYFKIPNSIRNKYSELSDIFNKHKNLIPYFPSILIGNDFDAAIELLDIFKNKTILTDNSGVAFEAFQRGISWIAGPHMNITNSYSLLALKDNFDCQSAFISNEVNQNQIRKIIKPKNIKLYYSIYHPIILMTSRQCLLQQVTGCEKHQMDDSCISVCNRFASITNMSNHKFFINKSEGNYHKIYNESNFLNLEIIKNPPIDFSGYFIDLSDIKTDTKVISDKIEIINLFENLIKGDLESANKLKEILSPTSNTQYKKGI